MKATLESRDICERLERQTLRTEYMILFGKNLNIESLCLVAVVGTDL